MEINYLEWFGYLASLVVLVSLLTSSIIKLRWINLVGASLFATYGFFIGSIPTAAMNFGIVLIDIYYLIKIYSTKEYFQLLELTPDSNYFTHFMEFYNKDIKEQYKHSNFEVKEDMIGFYILRNVVTAGIFLASKRSENELNIEFDYAIGEYRDFKTGKFIYEQHKDFFLKHGYNKLYSKSLNQSHEKYLIKMGFEKVSNSDEYVKVFN